MYSSSTSSTILSKVSGMDGERYIGINLKWDIKRQVHLSIPGYSKGLKTVQPSTAYQTSASTLLHYATEIWSSQTICQRGIYCTSPRQERQTFHPASLWKIPIPRQSRRQYIIGSNQCNCLPSCQPNHRHPCPNQPTFGLHCNSGRCSAHIFRQ